MVAIVLKAKILRPQTGLESRFCQRPAEEERNSPEEALGLAMTVERPQSLSLDSVAKVRHSEVSSME